MLPSQLTAESFAEYPPEARALAVQHLATIQRMPEIFAALLMREIRGYDWLFPAERRAIEDQFSWLESLQSAEFDRALQGFKVNGLPADLQRIDWVRKPEEYLGALTAALWSTHQMDGFRATARVYADSWRKAHPEPQPIAPRLAVVVLGSELRNPEYPLFRKLRTHGVFVPKMDDDGWTTIVQAIAARAAKYPDPLGHWYIDGGARDPQVDPKLASVVWGELDGVRAAMLARMQSVIRSGHGGPEELRTMMAETTPHQVALPGADDALNRFRLSILAEGSGTQIFSTSFVQWTAREALRRAQPVTMLVRFQPRQRQLPMNDLLAGAGDRNAPDPAGSLIDADMGAYYTWIDQQRLTGADQSAFLAWSEAHGQAVIVGPMAPRGAVAGEMTMRQIFDQLI